MLLCVWFLILFWVVLFGVFFYAVCAGLVSLCKIWFNPITSKLNNARFIVSFFKFVFVAIGHPCVLVVCLYIRDKTKTLLASGYYTSSIIHSPSGAFVLFLLFALLFYAGWLVMLTCVFKIIKPKLNIKRFLN